MEDQVWTGGDVSLWTYDIKSWIYWTCFHQNYFKIFFEMSLKISINIKLIILAQAKELYIL